MHTLMSIPFARFLARRIDIALPIAQNDTMTTATIPQWRIQDRLARALDEAGLSVQEMADELEVHRNTIGNYLAGRRPSKATLGVWAIRCGVPYRWLAFGEAPEDGDTTPVTLWYLGGYRQDHLRFAA